MYAGDKSLYPWATIDHGGRAAIFKWGQVVRPGVLFYRNRKVPETITRATSEALRATQSVPRSLERALGDEVPRPLGE